MVAFQKKECDISLQTEQKKKDVVVKFWSALKLYLNKFSCNQGLVIIGEYLTPNELY